MVADLFKIVVYCAVMAGVIYVGWDEPLRHRFMSPTAIASERRLAQQAEEAANPSQFPAWRPMGTALDRAPYEVQKGVVKYSKNFDPRKTGSPTEVEYRKNTVRYNGVER